MGQKNQYSRSVLENEMRGLEFVREWGVNLGGF